MKRIALFTIAGISAALLAAASVSAATHYQKASSYSGVDICSQIQQAIAALPSDGGYVDASDITGPQTCTTKFWSSVQKHVIVYLNSQITEAVDDTIPSTVTLWMSPDASIGPQVNYKFRDLGPVVKKAPPATLTWPSAVIDQGGQVYNAKAYGAKGDGVFLYSCSATNGNATVTCTDGAFAASDVGKAIEIDNAAGSQPDITTIASVTDATHVVVAAAPAFTLATTNVVYGTDDTSAIQNLINTVFAAGGGTILFPTANYILAGALGGPASNNAILYIPQIDTSSSIANPFPTLTLSGPGAPSAETLEAPYATFLPTASSAVLYGMTWGNGAGNIIGGPGSTPFDSCTVSIQNLTVRTRNNPDISALGLTNIKNAMVRNVTVGVNLASTINVVQPTFTNIVGIKMPTVGSSGVKDIENTSVWGYYTLVQISEHGNMRNLELHQGMNGVSVQSSVHPVYFDNVDIEAVKMPVIANAKTPVFGTVTIEHESSGWYTTTTDLTVSTTVSQQCYGFLYMSVYNVSGGAYVAPTVNVLPRYLMVYAAGVGMVGGVAFDTPFTFAQLGTTPVVNGMRVYCSDCKNVATDGATFDSAIASGGTGTPVVGENGAWRVH